MGYRKKATLNMQQHGTQVPPFRVCIWSAQTSNCPKTTEHSNAHLSTLLPASHRTGSDDITPPHLDDINYFEKELSVNRLSQLSEWLWLAGRPMPPRPLHHQFLLGREIIIAEQMDLHLVWTSGRMFLKPIPRYLLEPDFWTLYLTCRHDHPCTPTMANPCLRQNLWKCALGFLFSYAALISYESDFLLAQERHLIPREFQWQGWRRLVGELDTEHIHDRIDTRYLYGELRLSRLNKMQYLRSGLACRGYMPTWNRYNDFFSDNFAWLASAIVYVAIVLTALQVGLATDVLQGSHAFQSASYGFTVFAIISPLAGAALIVGIFLYIFFSNCISAAAYKRHRLLHVHAKLDAA